MHHARHRIFYHRDPSLARWRRAFEWFLTLTLLSMGAAGITGLAAIAWNAAMGGLTHSDFTSHGKTPVAFIFLCLAWWVCLSMFIARSEKPVSTLSAPQASAPQASVPQASARALVLSLIEAPKATFLIAPVWAFILTQLTSTVTWPVLRLNLSGTGIEQLTHVEKLENRRHFPKWGQHCSTAARLILSQEMQLDRCLTDDLYNALKPGDGVQITVQTHGDHMQLTALDRVPAAEMPAVLPQDRDLLALLLRRAARDQRGTRAQ